jgi:hypothetical protein
MQICLDSNDRIVRLKVIRGSGSERVDADAVHEAYQTKWEAATVDGKRVLACSPFHVIYRDIH